MTYREKKAWAELVATIAVWGWYFVHVWSAATSGALETLGFAAAVGAQFVTALVIGIGVSIAAAIVVETTSRKADRGPADERERLAVLRASNAAYVVVMALVLALSCVAFFTGAFNGVAELGGLTLAAPVEAANALVVFANAALAAFVLAEIVQHGLTVILLRRGD